MAKKRKVRRKITDKKFWLERGLIMLLVVGLVNVLLLGWLLMIVIGFRGDYLVSEGVPVKIMKGEKREKFDQYRVGELISKAGYEMVFSNPRYEFDEERSLPLFKVEVMMENHSFQPYISTGGNCDIVKDGVIVRNMAGVSLSELRDVYPGEKLRWEITVLLDAGEGDHEDEKDHDYTVSSCIYAPQGSYDPNLTVEIVFE